MPKIECSTLIKTDNAQKIYEIIKDMEKFHTFMPNVKSIKIDRKYQDNFISIWDIVIDGAHITWTEHDMLDDTAKVIKFNMLEGDYNKYDGQWCVEPSAQSTKISIEAEIDWGAPALVRFKEVSLILEKKARKAFRTMLLAIKKKAERES